MEHWTMPQDGSQARQRILDAAVAVIVDEGFYRASSNRIAARAGLTWGVIQHHFGTRNGLLLEVVRQAGDDLTATLEGAVVEGESLLDRLRCLADVVWAHYRRPEFLAVAQIVMNLSRDPSTAADTLTELDALTEPTHEQWQRLVDQVVAPGEQPVDLARALYRILRGVAVGDELLDSMAARTADRSDDRTDRELLLGALAGRLGG